MWSDLLINDLARSRVDDMLEVAEANRRARLVRSNRASRNLPAVFASLAHRATSVVRRGRTAAAIPRQRVSIDASARKGSRSVAAARSKGQPSAQCC
jgi:hypothetical protein